MRAIAATAFDRSLGLTDTARQLIDTARFLRCSAQALRQRRKRPLMGGSGGTATLAERLGAVIKAGHPYAYCFRCLSHVMMLSEKAVREAAQVALLHDGFGLKRRVCHQCEGVDNALVVKDEE